jgi:integrase
MQSLGGYISLLEAFFVGIQELPGHKDVKTTMVYTHVLNQGPKGVRSPMDEI